MVTLTATCTCPNMHFALLLSRYSNCLLLMAHGCAKSGRIWSGRLYSSPHSGPQQTTHALNRHPDTCHKTLLLFFAMKVLHCQL